MRYYNFWNFDIQGAIQSIQDAELLYLEVNEKELYKNCGLIDEIDMFLSIYNFRRVLTRVTPHGWGMLYTLKINESFII